MWDTLYVGGVACMNPLDDSDDLGLGVLGVNEFTSLTAAIFEDDPGMTVTKSEVLQPSTDWVQKMVYGFLKEFGYSEFMNQSSFSCVDLHAGNLSSNIQDTLHLDILVVATRKFFQRIQYTEVTFGIMDVVEPEPKVRNMIEIKLAWGTKFIAKTL